MFGKLLKYDFKALLKIHLGMYLFLFIMSLAVVFSRLLERSYPGNLFSRIFGPLLIGLFILGAMAGVVVSIVLGILRYRKNVLKDEGYLTNTLPVESWQIHISKLIVSSIYVYLTAIVVFLLIVFESLDFSWVTDLYEALTVEMSVMFGGSFIMNILFIALAITPVFFLSNIYACMCVGYKSSKNKDAMSFVMYIIFYAINQISSFILVIVGGFVEFGNIFSMEVLTAELTEVPINFLRIIVIGSLVLSTVLLIVYNLVSVRMLDRYLNLE